MGATAKTDWFWSDWLADPAVRRLNAAERGIWIDLLALAAAGKPTGYVCDSKGRPIPLGEIARTTNCADLDELAKLVDGIVEKGAGSRDRAGRVFNRRMVREAQLSAKRSEAGLLGVEAKRLKNKQTPDLVQQNTKQNPERRGSLDPPNINSGGQIKNGAGAARASDDWPADYRDQFWTKYPHKVGKADAITKLERARTKVTWADLNAGLDRYIAKTDDRPWCNPATWLHQERWADQPSLFNGGTRHAEHREGGRTGGPGRGFGGLALQRARAAGLHD